MNIKGSTRLYALIGNNISHSYSPIIHNYLFNFFKINAVYVPIEYKSNLETFFNFFRKTANFSGINITIPYKEQAFKLSDIVIGKAKDIKTVNCIKKENGKIEGINTDCYGFLKSLEQDLNLSSEDKKVVIFGSGGTAKTIVCSLIDKVKHIYIFSRKKDNIEELLEKYSNITWHTFENSVNVLKFNDIDLIVNTTPLGLYGETINIDFSVLKEECKIFDVLYIDTPLIQYAKKTGFSCINGINMLIYQAVKSFEFWTNIKINDNIIEQLKIEVSNEK